MSEPTSASWPAYAEIPATGRALVSADASKAAGEAVAGALAQLLRRRRHTVEVREGADLDARLAEVAEAHAGGQHGEAWTGEGLSALVKRPGRP